MFVQQQVQLLLTAFMASMSQPADLQSAYTLLEETSTDAEVRKDYQRFVKLKQLKEVISMPKQTELSSEEVQHRLTKLLTCNLEQDSAMPDRPGAQSQLSTTDVNLGLQHKLMPGSQDCIREMQRSIQSLAERLNGVEANMPLQIYDQVEAIRRYLLHFANVHDGGSIQLDRQSIVKV